MTSAEPLMSDPSALDVEVAIANYKAINRQVFIKSK